MKIRFAKDMGLISGDSMIEPEELAGSMGIERIASLSKEAIAIVTDIFKNHPEFKQVTLDTMTDEEKAIQKQAINTDIKNNSV